MEREGWYRRVVPVTALLAGLVAALALLFPGVRHQLALSASRQPQEYVELAFARATTGTVLTCVDSGDSVRVAFDVTSHLDRTRDVSYVVTVAGHPRTGSVAVEPGATAHVAEVLDRPARDGYEVRVELPGEGREVFARCGAAR